MRTMAVLLIFLFSLSLPVLAEDRTLTDDEIRRIMIRDSIAAYPGRCPCPYNLMRNGKGCGNWSAYIRKGGYSPLCYPEDVTDEMVKEYREKHGLSQP